MQWDVEPVAAQMSQMAEDLTARINALDPESESPVFSDFNFVITTGDWELTNGLYKARVTNTVLLTATAGIQVFYDASLRTALVGDIYEDKHTGYIDFYTTLMPTGSITGIVRVIDSTGGNVQVQRGGTGASTPKGARTNLNTPIRDIPVNFGTVSSLPQTIYDADLTADMVAFDAVFGNPAAIPSGIDVTFAAGSVTITGTLVSGAETTIKFWAHEQRTAVEGTETPAEQQRITDFVQVQAQTLTTAQQAQVRTNIGAADTTSVAILATRLGSAKFLSDYTHSIKNGVSAHLAFTAGWRGIIWINSTQDHNNGLFLVTIYNGTPASPTVVDIYKGNSLSYTVSDGAIDFASSASANGRFNIIGFNNFDLPVITNPS